MTKIRPYLIALLVIASLVSAKFFFFPSEKPKPEKGAKENVVPVTVFVTGDSALIEKVFATGTLTANEQVDLKTETSGSITYLNLPEGKSVQVGTLLLKVNDAEIRAQYEKVRVQLHLARREEERQRNLLREKAISLQEYDISLTNYKALQADSAYYHAQLDKTEVRAPFTGVLGIKNVSLGGYVTPSVTVAQIHQLDPVKVDFSLPEKYSSSIRVGDVITFTTDDKHIYKARIIVRDPAVDLASRTIRYRAVCDNPKGELLPGAFVRIDIVIRPDQKSLFIPTESVVPVLNGKKAFVVNDGIAQERRIETGFRTSDNIQVLSGLQPGDSVVVNGSCQLKNGNAVKVLSNKKDKKIVSGIK